MAGNFGFDAFNYKAVSNYDKPFVFISYKSEDEERVAKYAKFLNGSGKNVWYDNGIGGGNLFGNDLMDAIDNCSLVLFFASKSAKSSFIETELQRAMNKQKQILTIKLDDVKLSSLIKNEMLVEYIEKYQAIHEYNQPESKTKGEISDCIAIVIRGGIIPRDENTTNGNNSINITAVVIPIAVVCAVMFILMLLFATGVISCGNNEKKDRDDDTSSYQIISSTSEKPSEPTGSTSEKPSEPTGSTSEKPSEPTGSTPDSGVVLSDLYVGKVVQFGNYEQDTGINGKEPIYWKVLSIQGGKALLFSESVLDVVPFNNSKKPTSWSSCSLRTWMNGRFLESAFNSTERERISLTTNANTPNYKYNTSSGSSTNDYVFCLSIDDILSYFDTYYVNECISGDGLSAFATPYASQNGVRRNDSDDGAWWWLRTLGNGRELAAYVSGIGRVKAGGYVVNQNDIGIRPALWYEMD